MWVAAKKLEKKIAKMIDCSPSMNLGKIAQLKMFGENWDTFPRTSIFDVGKKIISSVIAKTGAENWIILYM